MKNPKEEAMKNAYLLNEKFGKYGIAEAIRPQLVGTLLLYLKGKHKRNEDIKICENQTPDEIRSDIKRIVQMMIPENLKGTVAEKLIIDDIVNDSAIEGLTSDEWSEIITWTMESLFIPMMGEEVFRRYQVAYQEVIS